MGKVNEYTKTWVSSAEKCKPTEEWHWKILERDFQIEFEWVRKAFIGRISGSPPATPRGKTWDEVEAGARTIAAALARRFHEHNRTLPYVNTLWLMEKKS